MSRAKGDTLRKITRAQAAAIGNGCGGIVDESVDIDRLTKALMGEAVDIDAFVPFFGSRLGIFRGEGESRRQAPTRSVELTFIDETMDAIEQVRTRLENLPARVDDAIQEICVAHRMEHFRDRAQRLDAELLNAWMMLAAAAQKIEAAGCAKRGTRTSSLRDWLLCEVARWLEVHGVKQVERAANIAARCLRSQRVPAPNPAHDGKEARRIVRAVAKSQGERTAAN